MGRAKRKTYYNITRTVTTKRTPAPAPVTEEVMKEELRQQIREYTSDQMLENIKVVRKGVKLNVVHTDQTMFKLSEVGKIKMIAKYADIILAMNKLAVQQWVNGATWSPIEHVKGYVDEGDQKKMIKYLRGDKCSLSKSKADRLRRHMGLKYREVKYYR